MEILTRVAAYAWIEDAGRVLLTHWVGWPERSIRPAWTLPGGGMEAGEDVEETVRREVQEETGLEIAEVRLIGTHTFYRDGDDPGVSNRSLRILHTARATGGELGVREIDGSTDDVRWFRLDEIAEIPHVELVDIARDLGRRVS